MPAEPASGGRRDLDRGLGRRGARPVLLTATASAATTAAPLGGAALGRGGGLRARLLAHGLIGAGLLRAGLLGAGGVVDGHAVAQPAPVARPAPALALLALAGIGYAVWQTLRADDDLWVADDEPELPPTSDTPTI